MVLEVESTLKRIVFVSLWIMPIFACQEEKEHIAPAINPQDSVSVMTSWGVNTLISDSGMIRYRIVAECWEVNQVRRPSRWIFEKGIFLEQFDEKFHVEAHIQADTAWYYDEKKLWELRGRVKVHTVNGLRFSSEELYWDQNKHEMYSSLYSHVKTPDREMRGSWFRSDEHMRHYIVSNSKGSFVRGHDGMGTNAGDTILTAPDSVKTKKRQPVQSKPKISKKEPS